MNCNNITYYLEIVDILISVRWHNLQALAASESSFHTEVADIQSQF
jgi:hypothetical protein